MTLEVRTLNADDFALLTFDEAVEITEDIRVCVADLELKIVKAYFGQAWRVMDYGSWDDYVLGEFKQAPLVLPREDRRSSVASLRQQGLSLRAIAAVTGVSESTTRRDVTASNGAVEMPDSIVGLDGRERPATRPSVSRYEAETNDTPPEPREACPTCGQIMPVESRKER